MVDKKKLLKEIRNWVLTFLGAFLIASLVNSKVFAKVTVEQESMENTLFPNQGLIVDKLSYNFTSPKDGDIVVFLKNEEKGTLLDDTLQTADSLISVFSGSSAGMKERLIKRVIGVEGDTVDIKDGYVYVNGEKLEEPYAKDKTLPEDFKGPLKVGKNKLFVLGDNRMVSLDSRMLGLIDLKQVEGKAVFRIYPFDEISRVK